MSTTTAAGSVEEIPEWCRCHWVTRATFDPDPYWRIEDFAPTCPVHSEVREPVGVVNHPSHYKDGGLNPAHDWDFAERVNNDLAALGELLIAKNKAYGDSALNPLRVFSSASPIEQLKVRIDDKLSRIAKGSDFGTEDTVDDLIGYLVLYKLAMEDAE